MSYPTSRAFIGSVLALTAAVAFAFSNTSASLAFHGGSNPITLAATRFVLPALILVVWLTAQGRAVWLPKRDGWIAVSLGALTAAYSWALLSAIGSIPLALAILIFYLFPLVATVILGVCDWDKLGWNTITAIGVAFVGLALALDPRVGHLDVVGMSLAFLCFSWTWRRDRCVGPGSACRRFSAGHTLYGGRLCRSADRFMRSAG